MLFASLQGTTMNCFGDLLSMNSCTRALPLAADDGMHGLVRDGSVHSKKNNRNA
jgi:hypothetical protein